MYGASDVVGEFIKRSKKTEELRESGSNSYGEHGVPDEESNNGILSDSTFFPSDFRMRNVGNDGSNGGGDEIR